MKMELRNKTIEFKANDESLVVEGYVNETGRLSEILGKSKKFREKIAPGAFQRAIDNSQRDIDFLAEHDNKKILSSTRNGSLELREDDKGLFMSAKITPTSWGKDVYTLIKSGIYRNMSFGFRSIKDSWRTLENGLYERTIEELELFEVSVVKDPAYSQSTISARGIEIVDDVKVPDKILEFSDDNKDERGSEEVEKMETRTTNEFEKELRSLNTTANGTALIPENVQNEIVKKMEDVSDAFARARKIPSVHGELKVARESDSVTGGFFGEGEEILEESIAFEYATLKQKRVGAALSLSNQLINDSAVDIVGYVSDLVSRRLAKTVEQAIFNGDGIKEFSGILNDSAVQSVAVESEALTIDDVIDLYTALHPAFLDGASFYMDRPTFSALAKLKDNNGHMYMQNGVVNGKITYTLLGLPVSVTEGLNATTPIVLADLAEGYSIMVKQDMKLQTIIDSQNALRGSQLIVADSYMDGAVTNPAAIVKLNVAAESN